MPSYNKIMHSLKVAGFNKVEFELYEIKENLEDLFLYSGKNQPEKYLNPDLRKNISTFAALADPDEVEKGCSLLREDIHSGRAQQVIKSYRNKTDGDYIFIIGKK